MAFDRQANLWRSLVGRLICGARGDLNSRHTVYKTDALISELLGQAHSRALFSAHPAMGTKTRKILKYRAEASWPIMTKGCSTGMPPIHVRIITSATSSQNKNCVTGRKVMPRCLDVCRMGTSIRTRIEKRRARTPPSLLGIERRMA